MLVAMLANTRARAVPPRSGSKPSDAVAEARPTICSLVSPACFAVAAKRLVISVISDSVDAPALPKATMESASSS
jgi:hypothetical protein